MTEPADGMIRPSNERCIDTIRFLAVDAVQKANSGHPGMPMGAAPMAYVLWTRHLRFDSGRPRLARPRPLRPLGRPRLHAALRAAPPDGLRRHPRRSARASASGAASRRGIRSTATRRASRRPPGRSGRGSQRRRHGAGRALPGGDVQPRRARGADHYTYGRRRRRRPDGGHPSEAASLAGHLRWAS